MATPDVAPDIGRRLIIFGFSGAGKSTLARQLAETLGIDAIELSGLHWQPGWQAAPADELWRKLEAELATHPEGWACEGGFSVIPTQLLAEADSAVWLRTPWPTAFRRLFARTLHRVRTRELLWGTNRETWSRSFFSRDSIFVYAPMQGLRDPGKVFAKAMRSTGKPVFELSNQQQIDSFLRSLAGPTE